MRYKAIVKAYPSIISYSDSFNEEYGLDKDGIKVTIVKSNVDAAQAELDKLNYQTQRTGRDINGSYDTVYPNSGEQLDLLWHDIDDGKLGADAKTGGFYTRIKQTKDKYPKP